jgi:hypothetical protein
LNSNIAMRCFLTALAIGFVACGGNPPGPAAPTPVPSVNLVPGRYSLNLSNGTQGGAVCLRITTNPAGVAPTPSILLAAEAVSDGAGGLLIRPEGASDLGLTLKLRQAGAGFEGTLHGTAADTLTQQTVTVDGGTESAAATVSGSPLSAQSIGGEVAGRVSFARDGSTTSCNANNWTLSRRQ